MKKSDPKQPKTRTMEIIEMQRAKRAGVPYHIEFDPKEVRTRTLEISKMAQAKRMGVGFTMERNSAQVGTRTQEIIDTERLARMQPERMQPRHLHSSITHPSTDINLLSLLTSVFRFIRDLFARTGNKTNLSFENVHESAERAQNEDEDEALAFEGLSRLIASGESRSNLERAIRGARERSDPLHHLLLLGAEKLAKAAGTIIARDLGVNIRVASGARVKTAADLAALLTNLEEKDVLLIHGIDRLDPKVEELLCSAMEKFMLSLLIGEGTQEREVTIDLARFTLVGSTSAEDRVSRKLDEQFPVTIELLSKGPSDETD